MSDYEIFMSRCLQLARLGQYEVAPNPMVGAVLVSKDGLIIGEGWHRQFGGAHAEVNCINAAESKHKEIDYSSSTLFVSLEPCSHFGKTPPCADLIISKGIGKVVVGCLDPNKQVAGNGIKKLREAGVEVTVGVMEAECREVNKRFITLHEKGRPYVILKWAQTADGFMGSAARRIPISTARTKTLVHKMRAENMAILVGANTALIDNPRLLCTHWAGHNPVRILLDRHKRVPPNYNIYSTDAPTIVYSDNTDWSFVLRDLAQRDIHSVLVEGGATVHNYIISTGIYDEIHIETNPSMYLYEGIAAPKVVPLPHITTEMVDGNIITQMSE